MSQMHGRCRSWSEAADPARWPELYTLPPAGRVGQPAEVAAMVAFLASPKSSYTSGVVITLDAGISSRSGAG
jgi:NAD(P)-dependent dehydrogenase (short-subunit alcohol dehydrogenase family)